MPIDILSVGHLDGPSYDGTRGGVAVVAALFAQLRHDGGGDGRAVAFGEHVEQSGERQRQARIAVLAR